MLAHANTGCLFLPSGSVLHATLGMWNQKLAFVLRLILRLWDVLTHSPAIVMGWKVSVISYFSNSLKHFPWNHLKFNSLWLEELVYRLAHFFFFFFPLPFILWTNDTTVALGACYDILTFWLFWAFKIQLLLFILTFCQVFLLPTMCLKQWALTKISNRTAKTNRIWTVSHYLFFNSSGIPLSKLTCAVCATFSFYRCLKNSE